MNTLSYILIFTIIGSILSLAGGVVLLLSRKHTERFSHFLVSFAAGTLLATAFFDLFPEALVGANSNKVFIFGLGGFLFFFVLHRFIYFLHHHHSEVKGEKPTVALIMFGDSIHNFIDGVAIAATFMVSIPLGIITSFAVAAHEIPQEIGDFAVMLRRGLSPKKVFGFNIFSAFTAIIGAVLTFYLGERIQFLLPLFLSVTAGFFLYIAATDLIPEIHENNRKGFALIETTMLFLGVVSVYVLISLLEH